MNEQTTKTERIYGVINKWKEQCTRYQEMKEKCIKLLEHPESTEEQLLEVARILRDTRSRMSEMKDLLNATHTAYVFDLTGKVGRKALHRWRGVVVATTTKPTTKPKTTTV